MPKDEGVRSVPVQHSRTAKIVSLTIKGLTASILHIFVSLLDVVVYTSVITDYLIRRYVSVNGTQKAVQGNALSSPKLAQCLYNLRNDKKVISSHFQGTCHLNYRVAHCWSINYCSLLLKWKSKYRQVSSFVPLLELYWNYRNEYKTAVKLLSCTRYYLTIF